MATNLLSSGDTAASSAWQTLGASDAHTIIITGTISSSLIVEARTGAGNDDATAVGSLSISNQPAQRIQGPIQYRVRRVAGTSAGCVVETGA